ncbi:hypothetical protein BcepF1.093 [Burkholderia phage BcepF1]|uniref:Uncharacterized protein n=1 Tax=Burkholderia phage BcepF1 TaxID=2886897 RepID=A1YZZ7_9CAUD|nr:hypothetical protein BcepF1.093 [Burkholderia phage BcepF1]ABL96824.1 hypothetical protein BcepF1.093 [Burkholderia phage BcepF1]
MFKWKKRRFRWLPRLSNENIEIAADIAFKSSSGLTKVAFLKGAIIALITGLSQLNPDYVEALVEEATKIISTH